MLLVQRLPEHDILTVRVLGRVYKTHKDMIQDMKKNPAKFNENFEYNTIEMGEWAKVSYVKKAKVETVNIPIKEEKE